MRESYTLNVDVKEVLRACIANPAVEGLFQDESGGWYVDRRYTTAYVEQSWYLTPRTADLNIIGPTILAVPSELIEELGIQKNTK